MSPLLRAGRRSELAHVLWSARKSRDALTRHDVASAFIHYSKAVEGLAFIRALYCSYGVSITASAGLGRVLRRLGDAIEAAVRPAPRVEAADLVPAIFESLQVLQRKGVDVEDGLLLDRARNTACGLLSRWRFTALQ